MHKPVYIRSARAICAQDCFSTNRLPETFRDAEKNTLKYLHPNYHQYFSIMQLRRMSTLTRTGMVAAMECLADAGIEHPEAIVTGTGKGSISDTEKFIRNIKEFSEGTLNPTPFIQSTYNSLNGLISLQHKTNCYNTTFVHRGHSLELAFIDALLQFREGSINNALVGSFEEISEEHFIIREKLGYWKPESVSSKDLLPATTPGTIAGEGTFFFVLQHKREDAMAEFRDLRILFEPVDGMLDAAMNKLLAENECTVSDIDLLILGKNGDLRYDHFYDELALQFGHDVHILAFKTVSGEFDTASGFAVWLAAITAFNQELHPELLLQRAGRKKIRNILIYNHYNGEQHALYLFRAVGD